MIARNAKKSCSYDILCDAIWEISQNSNMDIFSFLFWLKCSFGDVHFAENPTWIGSNVMSNWRILRKIENNRIHSRLSIDSARLQHTYDLVINDFRVCNVNFGNDFTLLLYVCDVNIRNCFKCATLAYNIIQDSNGNSVFFFFLFLHFGWNIVEWHS